jgi:hypothetical protein
MLISKADFVSVSGSQADFGTSFCSSRPMSSKEVTFYRVLEFGSDFVEAHKSSALVCLTILQLERNIFWKPSA